MIGKIFVFPALTHRATNMALLTERFLSMQFNLGLRLLRAFLLFLILTPSLVSAQVTFTSPLPFGIAQVHGDHADIRLHVAISGYSNFSYKLSSDVDTSSPQEGWAQINIHNGIVDTLLTIPKSLRDYSIYWRTGLGPTDTGGIIARLTPGHIIGIAGQSNAVGHVWPDSGKFVAVPQGDIRMLINNSSWQQAGEPTDGEGQGPWIEMANELYAKIGDTLPIGIVNRAVDGTGLTLSIGSGRWLKNSPDTNDKMYPNAVDRFRHAGSELECLTWIQGEADGQGGGVLWNPAAYHTQFGNLIRNFESDLADTFPVFHLQISGFSGNANSTGAYPIVREAQRVLPPSTIVGTAIGRPLWDSAFHYTVATYQAVGQMFAGAVLKELYGINAPMYPPLMPDTVATLDSITDGSIKGKYCFSIGWTRAGKPVTLTSLSAFQYFAIGESGIPVPLYDT
ncbi:MAG TPA: sialate O-acetylesterase, partial [Candidatus Kapabacteria bacterium]|nr:sialate O-acetylesterase [Candidatus Kapabacteria bacterium]